MYKREARRIAMLAARAHLRKAGIDPNRASVYQAELSLDELATVEPDLIASIWYLEASDNQRKLFDRDWKEYQEAMIRIEE